MSVTGFEPVSIRTVPLSVPVQVQFRDIQDHKFKRVQKVVDLRQKRVISEETEVGTTGVADVHSTLVESHRLLTWMSCCPSL